jgi:predicted transcriptional regulator
MRNSIMTEKIARRGVQPPAEYVADVLTQILVREVASKGVVALQATETIAKTREWLATAAKGTSHQGFPVLDDNQCLVGVLTRRDLLDAAIPTDQTLENVVRRAPKFIYDDCTVRQAADHMLNHGIGRLPVVRRGIPPRVIGMVTRRDVLSAFRHGLHEGSPQKPTISMRFPRLIGKSSDQRTSKTS